MREDDINLLATKITSSLTEELLRRKVVSCVAAELLWRMKEEQDKDRGELFDRRLYNTRMLLANYREFKRHAENAVCEMEELEKERSAVEIMDAMMNAPVGRGEAAVESLKRSAQRTRTVVRHIDEMLRIYETCCAASGKPEDARRWDVVETAYVKERPKGQGMLELYKELAEKHFVSVRQIQRDIDDATVRLTALFFGVDGMDMLAYRRRGKKGKPQAEAERELK